MTGDPLELLREPIDRARIATIGTFDGVHRGHQVLMAYAHVCAQRASLPLTVITFDPPPAAVLRPDLFPGAIAPLDRKVEFLRQAGADEVVVLPFTEALAQITAEAFMEVLATDARVIELYTGEGFALGHKRKGTVEVLQQLSDALGMRFQAIPRVEDHNGIVSSSEVRRAIQQGDVVEAAALLGRWFEVSGEVIHGAQVGRQIGYPTANVMPAEGMVQLPDGIYATMSQIDASGTAMPSMTYIGTRPALNTGRRVIETHVLDFDGDLYGKTLKVEFIKRLRADANFPSVDELVAQLQRDEVETRAVLAGTTARSGA